MDENEIDPDPPSEHELAEWATELGHLASNTEDKYPGANGRSAFEPDGPFAGFPGEGFDSPTAGARAMGDYEDNGGGGWGGGGQFNGYDGRLAMGSDQRDGQGGDQEGDHPRYNGADNGMIGPPTCDQ